jgi:hypothetical protein
VKDPRVAIEEDRIQIAGRYEGRRIQSVLNISVKVYLTDRPNVVAMKIESARAGLVPLPLKRVMDEADKIARKAKGVSIEWAEQGGKPIALITLPSRHQEIAGRLKLEVLDLRPHEIYFSGVTEPDE